MAAQVTVLDGGRALVRRGVADTIGILPLYEYWLRTTRWRGAVRLHRREDAEVGVLSQQVGALPHALVATVVPTFRRPDRLGAAVESALAQTVTDHRVIVVDDGAGVDCSLPADPRLTVVHLSHNLGVAGVVRNVGIRLTRSDLVAFLDDDNTWEPNHLQVALDARRTGADLSYSMLRRVDSEGQLVDIFGQPFSRRAMREQSLVDTSALVVRRGTDVRFSRVPRRRGDFPGEDWEIVWRLSRRLRVRYIPEVTVRYVRHGGSHYWSWTDPPERS